MMVIMSSDTVEKEIKDNHYDDALRKTFGLYPDKDTDVINEILDALHRRQLTVSEAQLILHKAERAIGLIPFLWDSSRTIRTRELRH